MKCVTMTCFQICFIYEIRKHNQEIRNCNADDHPNKDNDEPTECCAILENFMQNQNVYTLLMNQNDYYQEP